MSQIQVLCEGYDDRAFLKCWLLHLGAVDLWAQAGFKRKRLNELLRDNGTKANDGDFCVRAQSGIDLVIRPCLGVGELWAHAETTLHDEVVSRLVLVCDSDRPAHDPEPVQGRVQRLAQLPSATPVDLVVWHCGDQPKLPGVPNEQTLERLICSAIAEAQPAAWKLTVEEFLRREPVYGPNHKNYAHAYWAKFFAHDFDDLYQAVWSQDRFPGVAAQLEARLRENGDWDRIASLVGSS